MSYQQVYERCKKLPISIKRTIIKDIVSDISGLHIKWCRAGMNEKNLRGLYLNPEDVKSTKFRNSNKEGGPVIVTERSLNRCWERLVYVKELMHVFDTDDQLTKTGENFEDITSTFGGDVYTDPEDRSPVVNAEFIALPMALGLLCPKIHLDEFRKERIAGTIPDNDIATAFRIPEQYVPAIMNPSFDATILSILKQ
ncbi:MAG: hypothetical protein HAW65_07245 [Alphaproteobacteria bacterium]|nr:hypothetical protein [Alphaproteobacteria bacterium]